MLNLIPVNQISLVDEKNLNGDDGSNSEKENNKNANATTTRKKSSRKSNNIATVKIAGRTATMRMDALDTFFYLMAERHRIYRKRAAGLPFPWTDDPVLVANKFCNVYRILDRGTQFVINEVINKGPQTHRETCFRVMLYKLFNRIPTWEYMVQKLGTPTWETFDITRYGRVLRARLLSSPIYTGVYQIPAPKLGYPTSHMNHLRQLQMMMDDDVPGLLLQKDSLKEAFELIESYPGMGPFLGLQLLLDLNLTSQLDFSENEWVTCGPGSRSYLRQIFSTTVSGIENDAIAYLHRTQNDHFDRLGIADPPALSDDRPGVSYVDIEHSLCECHKYVKLKKQLGVVGVKKKDVFKPKQKQWQKDEEDVDVEMKDVEMKALKTKDGIGTRIKSRKGGADSESESELEEIKTKTKSHDGRVFPSTPQRGEKEIIVLSDSDSEFESIPKRKKPTPSQQRQRNLKPKFELKREFIVISDSDSKPKAKYIESTNREIMDLVDLDLDSDSSSYSDIEEISNPNLNLTTSNSNRPAIIDIDVDTDQKVDVKADVKVTIKAEVKMDIKAEIKAEVMNEVKPEFKVEVKDELKPVIKPKLKLDPDLDLKAEAYFNALNDEGDDPGQYINDETDYEVSHIIADRRKSNGTWEYKVRWTGYGPEDDMWLPEQELRDAPQIMREWRALRRTRIRVIEKVKMMGANAGVVKVKSDGASSQNLKSRIKNFSV